jgi:hypothetical protein
MPTGGEWMKIWIGAALMLLGPALVEAAPSVSVAFMEGGAYLQCSSSWRLLSIGDAVPADAEIRLDANAYIDLKTPESDIMLTQKGLYSIRDLLAARLRSGSSGAAKALLETFAFLLRGPAHDQSGVLGARGNDESRNADSEWVETTTQDGIQPAIDALQAETVRQSLQEAHRTLAEASVEEIPEVHYHMAHAYSLSGDTASAVKQVSGAKPSSDVRRAGDYILVQAKLYADTFAFAYAVQRLKEPGNDLSADVQRASPFCLLLALGYQGVGDNFQEKESLSRVVAISSEGDRGKAAAQLLRNP